MLRYDHYCNRPLTGGGIVIIPLLFAAAVGIISALPISPSAGTPPSLARLQDRVIDGPHRKAVPAEPIEAPLVHGWNIDVVDVVEAGRCLTTHISASFVYAAFAATLVVIDISDPTTPTRVGYALLSGNCWSMARRGNYLYCQANLAKRVDIVDISNPAAPEVVGYVSSDGYNLAIDGDYLYAAHGNGFRIYNLSVPTVPSLVGSIATGNEYGLEMVVRDGYLYAPLFTGGLRVFDVTNPSNPTILATLPTGFGAQGIDVDGSLAYLVNFLNPGVGLYIIDISDPAAPFQVGFFSAPGTGYIDVDASQGHAYVVDNYGTLEVFDVSQPAQPIHQSSAQLCNLFDPWQIHVSGNIATIGGGYPALCVFDVSDPAEPTALATYDALRKIGVLDVAPAHLVLPEDKAGIMTVNLYNTNQRHFESGGQYYLDGSDVAVRADRAYVASCEPSYGETGGFGVFDISDPAAPVKLGFLSLVNCIYALSAGETHVFCSASQNLLSMDVSNPALPSIADQLPLPRIAWDIEVVEPYVYLANHSDGLRIVDAHDPLVLSVAGTLALGGDAWAIAVENQTAFIATHGENPGMRIVDVTNPQQPVLVGNFSMEGYGRVVGARDNFAYLSSGRYFRVLDVSTPSSPIEVANIAIGPLMASLVFAPPFIFGVQSVDGASSGPLLKFHTDFLTAVPEVPIDNFTLRQNVPNPFNPITTISFELRSSGHTRLEIFDARGRFVRSILDRGIAEGVHSAHWDGRDAKGTALASGVYFYRLTAGGHSQARKMVLLK